MIGLFSVMIGFSLKKGLQKQMEGFRTFRIVLDDDSITRLQDGLPDITIRGVEIRRIVEVAGNGHPGGQARYVNQMARWLHSNDPGRMVALDVWGAHPPTVAGHIYSHIDAIGERFVSGGRHGFRFAE